jgi:hypothetical protein
MKIKSCRSASNTSVNREDLPMQAFSKLVNSSSPVQTIVPPYITETRSFAVHAASAALSVSTDISPVRRASVPQARRAAWKALRQADEQKSFPGLGGKGARHQRQVMPGSH